MWRASVLWVRIWLTERVRPRGSRGDEEMLSLLAGGGEIGFGPRFRLQPAGLGRWRPGEATPRKRSAGRSARSRPGKTRAFFPPSRPERCKPPACNAVHRWWAIPNARQISIGGNDQALVVCSLGHARCCTLPAPACSKHAACKTPPTSSGSHSQIRSPWPKSCVECAYSTPLPNGGHFTERG